MPPKGTSDEARYATCSSQGTVSNLEFELCMARKSRIRRWSKGEIPNSTCPAGRHHSLPPANVFIGCRGV